MRDPSMNVQCPSLLICKYVMNQNNDFDKEIFFISFYIIIHLNIFMLSRKEVYDSYIVIVIVTNIKNNYKILLSYC